MRQNTTKYTLVIAAAAMLGLSACADSDSGKEGGGATGTHSPSPGAPASPTGTAPTGTAELTASVRNAIKALDTADRDVPGGQSFDLERESGAEGGPVWDVKTASNGKDQYNLTVSEDGTKVVNKRQDMTPDDDVAKLKDVQISAQEAVKLAAGRRHGEDLKSMEIDRDASGTTVWQVNTVKPGAQSGTETIIDARSGKLIGDKTSD
ncbi:PepSY domain-containing protein [Streptomyces sp. NPDC046261]|uniref:PepSY domain-containing protein n=1 Tax=Streptomyces sp. NPDC046261 TaxID=3157200 RepID=UPI0033D3DAE7